MRIIAGAHRGRVLNSPTDGGIRPTSDKVRGAIFNIVTHRAWPIDPFAETTRVLDGFCGSGALGFEALSRGAGFACFIDNSVHALKLARQNAETLKIQKQCAFEMRELSQPQTWRAEPFHLVFLDPPYRKGLPIPALQHLSEGHFIAEEALVIIETGEDEVLPAPTGWQIIDQRSWGLTAAHFLIRA